MEPAHRVRGNLSTVKLLQGASCLLGLVLSKADAELSDAAFRPHVLDVLADLWHKGMVSVQLLLHWSSQWDRRLLLLLTWIRCVGGWSIGMIEVRVVVWWHLEVRWHKLHRTRAMS